MSQSHMVLKPPREEDFALIAEWISYGSLGVGYTGDVAEDISAQAIRGIHEGGSARYLMIHVEGLDAIGALNYASIGHARSYAIAVIVGNPDCWSRGYGAEAIIRLIDHLFMSLDAHRVQFITAAYNIHTIPILVNRRLTIEGVLRDYFYIDGEYHDGTLWSVLRDEFFAEVARAEETGHLPYCPLVPVAEKQRAKELLDGYLASAPNASWVR